MKKLLLLASLVFLLALALPKTSFAAENFCCIKGQGGFCNVSNCALANNFACKKDAATNEWVPDEGCKIQISPPEQVKITDFGKLFSGAVAFILLIAFIMAFIYLVLGGLSWITSGGDKAAVETARNKIINALIGLIVVASTWALFQLVGGAIGFNILGGFNVPKLF